MPLDCVYPKEEIKKKFEKPVSIEIYGMNQIDAIAELEPGCLHEIGANAWMHYVESGAKVDPQKLSQYFDNSDPYLFRHVEKVIKRKVIQDIILVHAKVDDPELENNICGKLLLARTYLNNMHISDVEFSNPYEPVPESEQQYTYHEYRSLGLFSTLLDNLCRFSQENKISRITLSAASSDQVPYFETHGFKVEDTDFARQAQEYGMSIPMSRKPI